MRTAARRLRQLAASIVPRGAAVDDGAAIDSSSAAALAYPPPEVAETDEENPYVTGHALMSEVLRQDLADTPRVNGALEEWSTVELMDRARGLGASDGLLDACLNAGDVRGELLQLARSLEPPPPSAATVADLSVERDASVQEIVTKLDRYGACVIKHAADEALVRQIDEELEPFGAWSKDPEDRVEGSRNGRMGMNGVMHAPSTEHLLTHPTVLAAVNGLLGRHCRRIALKEIEIFAVQPGQGKQPFHREDQFWPWHHEPHPWACSVLWAIDGKDPRRNSRSSRQTIMFSRRLLCVASSVHSGEWRNPNAAVLPPRDASHARGRPRDARRLLR